MLCINKMRADHTIDFAAEELKKYLRMMMPEEGDIAISFDSEAKDGFRLGLLEDFGLSATGKDPAEDDEMHIDTTEAGGILAGSNPRSVLFSVYRFLKLNGCGFFFPGAEGELIPMKKVAPQKYHKLADYRYRGHSIEGDPSLEQVLAYIDYHAKRELNSFGGYGVFNYQYRYYNHRHNEKNRKPEEINHELADVQWRALYESEIAKRGLRLHGGGHTLIPKALGLKPTDRFLYTSGEKQVPEEAKQFMAMIGGKRDLYRGDPDFTNLCMSNPEVRRRMAKAAVEGVEANPHVHISGLFLADLSHNHCECEECQKKRPNDWWIMILNEIDAELTKKGLDNKLSFNFYVDGMFAPEKERLNNPDRFLLEFCPISRSYTSSINEKSVIPEPIPYVRNGWQVPKGIEELIALWNEWKKVYNGSTSVYEYHFWNHQYRDPGIMAIARRLYEDAYSYKITGMDGCMQDGSDRSFFPNGFHGYIYAETMMNRELDFEEEAEKYFKAFYGKEWQKAKRYLDFVSEAFDHRYMSGELSADPKKGNMYNPERAAILADVKEYAAEIRDLIKKQKPFDQRAQANAWKVLYFHTLYVEGLAEVFIEKCQGHNKIAFEKLEKFLEKFGKFDVEIERWFDFGLAADSIKIITKKAPKIEF